MRIQILSDLHLEFSNAYATFNIPPRAPYLALLGDIGTLTNQEAFSSFLTRQLANFKIVFFVLGNHEAYHSSWATVKAAFHSASAQARQRRDAGESLGELVLLDGTRYDVPGENTTILGCTLFSNISPARALDIGEGLNDFRVTEDWSVLKYNAAHRWDLAWLNRAVEAVEVEDPERRVVVFTHHCPTVDSRAQDPRHGGSLLKEAFQTDLRGEYCWRSRSVKLWAFGHTHFNCDFVDEETGKRVYTNQRGYPHERTVGFDGARVVEV